VTEQYLSNSRIGGELQAKKDAKKMETIELDDPRAEKCAKSEVVIDGLAPKKAQLRSNISAKCTENVPKSVEGFQASSLLSSVSITLVSHAYLTKLMFLSSCRVSTYLQKVISLIFRVKRWTSILEMIQKLGTLLLRHF
jgi:hypothetical protein